MDSYNTASQAVSNTNSIALSNYQTSMNSYNSAYQQWKNTLPINKDGLNTATIKQILYLNQEPTAQLQISTNQSPLKVCDVNGNYVLEYNSNVNGEFATATYTNLHNSYYIDSSGIQHQISKIVRHFSNLLRDYNPYSGDWAWRHAWGDNRPSIITNNDASQTIIGINNTPLNGAMYFNAKSVTIQDQYYDQNGNLINPINGYYVFSSLNRWKNNSGSDHIEQVNGNGIELENVAGSSISNHGGIGYADIENNTLNVNPNGTYQETNNETNNWDKTDSPYFYFGSIVGKIINSNPSITFSTQDNSTTGKNSFWFALTSKLPTPPLKQPTPPSYQPFTIPHPQSTNTNVTYHTNSVTQHLPLCYLLHHPSNSILANKKRL